MSLFSYSILSIDGGGIRGIIPCTILSEIEKRTQKPIAESFDLIAGTSTGGILASGLTIKDEAGKPKFPASELLHLYKGEKGKKIFKKPMRLLNKARLLFKPLYESKNISEVLINQFGKARLKNSYTDLLITSYDTHNKKPFYFRSRLAKQQQEEDFDICDVCRSTSAAPTYFPPKLLPYMGRHAVNKSKDVSLIDGGVFANNPSMLAYVEAQELWRKDPAYKRQFKMRTDELLANKDMAAAPNPDNFAPPILLISLGTGRTQKLYNHKETKGWGVKWIRPLIDILMQGVSESTHYQMQYMLPPYEDNSGVAHPRYYRLNIDIEAQFSEMDDTSDATLSQLEQYGKDIVMKYDKEIDEICKLLEFVAMEREERSFMEEEMENPEV
ncbi:MAG: patatin-like phospholipase family protein [Saprospiraceae bacterium]